MFTLQIDTGNAAFHDERTGEYDEHSEALETSRILKNVIGKLEDGCTYGTMYDYNGNRVGRWQR